MKKSEAAQLVTELIAAFPHSKVTEATSAVYEKHLADLSAEACRRAIDRLVGTAKFFPSIAEIRAAATDLKLGAQRTGLEAYQLAVSAARRHGYISPPRFNDERLDRAIAMCGGWVEFCSAPTDAAERVRFAELYDTLATRERQDAVTGIPLPESAGTDRLLK